MVQSWGTGLPDFTKEVTMTSGIASISGSIVSISGEISVSGAVSLIGNFVYLPKILVITAASGGQALGSGLTTSGYTVHNIIIKNPEVKTSGTDNYGIYFYSGNIAPVVYIGGCSGQRPYPGGGFICSGNGLPLAPGETIKVSIPGLDYIWAASETSGNPLSYIAEMR